MFTVPLVHSPSAENMFRRWLANLPSEKLCWVARSPIRAINKILAYASVYPAKILVAWKGARTSVLYFHIHCTKEAELCIVYSQKFGKSDLVLAQRGNILKREKTKKTSKTTKTPVSKQGTFLHSTTAHSLTTFHRFSSFITNPKAASFSPVEDVTSISFMPMQFRGPQKIFPLPVITAKCISTLSLTDFFCLIKTPGVSDEGI